jgi:hypothetical protein
MRANLETYSKEAGYDPEEQNINLRFVYVLNYGGIDSCGLYLYFGNDTLSTSDEDWDECYTQWYFSNYWLLGTWEWDEDWYTTDFETLMTEEDYSTIEKICINITSAINEAAETFYNSIESISTDTDTDTDTSDSTLDNEG